jgi:hypothetical protein
MRQMLGLTPDEFTIAGEASPTGLAEARVSLSDGEALRFTISNDAASSLIYLQPCLHCSYVPRMIESLNDLAEVLNRDEPHCS